MRLFFFRSKNINRLFFQIKTNNLIKSPPFKNTRNIRQKILDMPIKKRKKKKICLGKLKSSYGFSIPLYMCIHSRNFIIQFSHCFGIDWNLVICDFTEGSEKSRGTLRMQCGCCWGGGYTATTTPFTS